MTLGEPITAGELSKALTAEAFEIRQTTEDVAGHDGTDPCYIDHVVLSTGEEISVDVSINAGIPTMRYSVWMLDEDGDPDYEIGTVESVSALLSLLRTPHSYETSATKAEIDQDEAWQRNRPPPPSEAEIKRVLQEFRAGIRTEAPPLDLATVLQNDSRSAEQIAFARYLYVELGNRRFVPPSSEMRYWQELASTAAAKLENDPTRFQDYLLWLANTYKVAAPTFSRDIKESAFDCLLRAGRLADWYRETSPNGLESNTVYHASLRINIARHCHLEEDPADWINVIRVDPVKAAHDDIASFRRDLLERWRDWSQTHGRMCDYWAARFLEGPLRRKVSFGRGVGRWAQDLAVDVLDYPYQRADLFGPEDVMAPVRDLVRAAENWVRLKAGKKALGPRLTPKPFGKREA